MTAAKVARSSVTTLTAGAVLADAGLTAATFFAWAKMDAPSHRMRGWWVIFPAAYLVRIGIGAPSYLLLRRYVIRDR